jgi:hypothetical protein
MTIKKEMLDIFEPTTENTSFIPMQFRLLRLSLVNNNSFLRYHKNILIFRGNRVCQISYETLSLLLIRNLYINLTEKVPFLWRPHLNTLFPSCNVTLFKIRRTRLCQSVSLSHTKTLLGYSQYIWIG